MKDSETKTGLSLSGGSALGMAHIGVLKYFEEENIKIDYITGASAGAIVASLFAFGISIEDMIKEASMLSWPKISKIAPSRMGPVSNAALSKRITNFLGEKNIEDAKIPLSIMTTNIQSGESVLLSSGSVTEALRASSAIPGMFTPIIIEGEMLVDGGLSNNIPHYPLIDMGAKTTIGVNVLTNPKTNIYPKNYLDIIANAFTILIYNANTPSLKKFDVLIEPELSEYSSSDFSNIDKLVEEGYIAAKKAGPQIKKEIRKQTKWWRRLF